MPVLPITGSTPYDTVQTALLTARGRLNDRIETVVSVSGKILDNPGALAQTWTNSAWRYMQLDLVNMGLKTLIGDDIIFGLPPCINFDPGSQTYISWTGCTDGTNFYTSPTLPAALSFPLHIQERPTGQNACFLWPYMEPMVDGLQSQPKSIYNLRWEWRGDAIWMPGATQSIDLRVRYAKLLPIFSDIGSLRWFDNQVPIVFASDALSWYIVAEILGARGDMDAAEAYRERGKSACRIIMNHDTKITQRANVRRIGRSGNGYGGCNWD
jgi:hypothetical protein